MQTAFSLAQLADPDIAEADRILRACVHCGFCTATCPTYVLLGDERDSPRGRIYMIKDMLENDRPAPTAVATHVDRCLSCLSCMTTCPSGVHYMHLVDHARQRIEETFRRPAADRALRALLAWLLPHPGRFRPAVVAARLLRPLRHALPGRIAAMLELAPARIAGPSPVDRPQVFPARGRRRRRVALMAGCAQQVLAPQINEATVRLLTRRGIEVAVAPGAGCCGALVQHMGRAAEARRQAMANIDAWLAEDARAPLDAIVINAGGCGTTVRDYGFMFRDDPAYRDRAARVAELARDVTEVADAGDGSDGSDGDGSDGGGAGPLRVAYHSACSMQHGQQLREPPAALLRAAGFDVVEPAESHLCCGSAGTYNLLQPAIARRLRDRKVRHLAATAPQVIATGNIGCITQLSGAAGVPVVHTVELLDWAAGGPRPPALGSGC